MGISISGGSSDGTLSVQSNYIFANDAGRDSYFTINPSNKTLGVYVVSNSILQQWNGSVWLNMTPVIRGQQGVSGTNGIDGVSVTSVVRSSDDLVFNLSNSSTLTVPNFYVDMKGTDGANGLPGIGIPSGGNTGQVLAKTSATSYATGWVTPLTSLTISDEGSLVSQATKLNFIGSAVTAVDAGSGVVDITISGGGGGSVDSVNGYSGVVTLSPDDFDDSASTNKFISATDLTKLAGIEVGATGDLTASEIETLYESNINTNKFTDAEKTKLANLSNNFKGLFADSTARDIGVVSPVSGNYVIQTNTQTVWFYNGSIWIDTGTNSAGDMLKVIYDPANKSSNMYDVDNHETGSVNSVYSLIEKSKLAGIESGATADQTGSEIKVLYESEPNTNAFTDSYKTKLDGIESGATANSADSFLLDRANHTGNIDLGTF